MDNSKGNEKALADHVLGVRELIVEVFTVDVVHQHPKRIGRPKEQQDGIRNNESSIQNRNFRASGGLVGDDLVVELADAVHDGEPLAPLDGVAEA